MDFLVEVTSTKAIIESGRVQFLLFSFRGSYFHETKTGTSGHPRSILVEATSTKAMIASGRVQFHPPLLSWKLLPRKSNRAARPPNGPIGGSNFHQSDKDEWARLGSPLQLSWKLLPRKNNRAIRPPNGPVGGSNFHQSDDSEWARPVSLLQLSWKLLPRKSNGAVRPPNGLFGGSKSTPSQTEIHSQKTIPPHVHKKLPVKYGIGARAASHPRICVNSCAFQCDVFNRRKNGSISVLTN